MKNLIFIFFLLLVISMKGQAQNNEQLFSITIDSVTITPNQKPEVLLCYTTIKNLSKETIEFRESSMFKKHQEGRMWNLVIKKDGHILCSWVNKHDVDLFLGNFTIKKSKTKEYLIPLILDELSAGSDGGVGTYTIQIEVSNVETKQAKKQSILSNIVEFQIKHPISEFSRKD